MNNGSFWALLPWWAWFVIFVVLLAAEVTIQRLAKAGRIKSDSIWVRPTSRETLGKYFAFRVGLLILVVVVTIVVQAVRH